MFRARLEALLAEQRERMTLVCSKETVDDAFQFLADHDLSPEALDLDLSLELNIILKRKNDVQIEMSNRLNKYGWTSARIQDHMLKVFYAKTQAIGRVLKAFLDSRDPEEALQGYDGPKNVIEPFIEDEPQEKIKVFASGLDDLDIK